MKMRVGIALLACSALFLGCLDPEAPALVLPDPANLPQVSIVAVVEGFGTSEVNLNLDRRSIEGRIGLPFRQKDSQADYRMEGIRYSITYSYLDFPLQIIFSCDRVLVSGEAGPRPGIYYHCPRENVLAVYGSPARESWELAYADQGIAFGFDEERRLIDVRVFPKQPPENDPH